MSHIPIWGGEGASPILICGGGAVKKNCVFFWNRPNSFYKYILLISTSVWIVDGRS